MTDPQPSSGPAELPLVLDVHLAALQEIDRVVGNQKTLDEADTARVRGIIIGALSRPRAGSHPAEEAP